MTSCADSNTRGSWVVDHYYSKAAGPIPVQPLRISACYFDTDGTLRKFMLQDVAMMNREIGQLFYLDNRLHRIVLEDENQGLLFEVQVEYDEKGELFKLNNPQERVARGSNIISEPMVRDLILQGLKKKGPEDCMDIFRLRVNAEAYDLKTDRLPQREITAENLDSLATFFGAESVLMNYDFRINTRQYKINYYERVLSLLIEGVPFKQLVVSDDEQIAEMLQHVVGGDEVLSSFNTYQISVDDNELIDAGGFGLVDKPDEKIILSAEEVFRSR